MLDNLLCILIKFLNLIVDYLLDVIIIALAWVIALLPSFPVQMKPIVWGPFGNSVGYFIPIGDMLKHFALMLGLMVLWYSVQHIMRLIKMIK